MSEAYQSAADAIGIDAGDWESPDALLKQMATESKANGTSIVETYNTDLRSAAERLSEKYQGDALKSELQTWADDRAAWKSATVANYEANRGYDAGIDWFVGDITAGDLTLPDGVTTDMISITVLPSESSMDECAEYAGETFTLDEASDLPSFPLHPSCPHYKEVQIND